MRIIIMFLETLIKLAKVVKGYKPLHCVTLIVLIVGPFFYLLMLNLFLL